MLTEQVYTQVQEYCMRFLLEGIQKQQRGDTARQEPIPMVDAMPGKNILVVAPHLDDEVIGCGGLIHTYCANSAAVTMLFCSSGSGGPCTEDAAQRAKKQIERIVESKDATAYLGPVRQIYCNHTERRLKVDLGHSTELVALLNREQFDAVYTPGPNEMHPDHRAVWEWVRRSVQCSRTVTQIYLYEVWGTCHPNVLLRLSESAWQGKIASIHCYKSQFEHFDYGRLIERLSLGQERFAWMPQDSQPIEAFHRYQEVM